MAVQPKIARLKSQLAVTGLQKKDNPLFQVLDQLIKYLEQLQTVTQEEIVASGGSVTPILGADLITWSDESGLLANSRQLLAGTGISFDDTVANQRTIENTAQGSEWSVLTDGDTTNPEIVFDSDGDVVMVENP